MDGINGHSYLGGCASALFFKGWTSAKGDGFCWLI